MTFEKRKREAFRRLRALSAAAGEAPTGLLAIGSQPGPAELVARLMLGDLPASASRAPRLACLLTELQRLDSDSAVPALNSRARHG